MSGWHPMYDCKGAGHGPNASEAYWCHDCNGWNHDGNRGVSREGEAIPSMGPTIHQPSPSDEPHNKRAAFIRWLSTVTESAEYAKGMRMLDDAFLEAEAAQGGAPLDYSVPSEVANAEVEWGGRLAAPQAEGRWSERLLRKIEAMPDWSYKVKAIEDAFAAPPDPKMCCEWADPIVSDSGLMCRSCDSPLLPASKGARIVKVFDRYAIRESEGAASRAEGSCICGATAHRGDCHFGWHNPESCPAPRAEGQPLTDEERTEIRDWYDRLPEAVTPIYDEPPAEGLDAALADILRWTKPGSLYADGTHGYSPAGPEKVARIHNRARAAFGDAPLPPAPAASRAGCTCDAREQGSAYHSSECEVLLSEKSHQGGSE